MVTDSITYVQSLARLQMMSRHIVASWGRDFDVLLTPTIAVVPPEIGALYEGSEDDPLLPIMKAGDMAAFTPLFNVTGQPGISLPMHWTEEGVPVGVQLTVTTGAVGRTPVGVQLVGRPWGEAELIRLASQIEEAAPWRERRPPVG